MVVVGAAVDFKRCENTAVQVGICVRKGRLLRNSTYYTRFLSSHVHNQGFEVRV
jgi:hypothetical protein